LTVGVKLQELLVLGWLRLVVGLRGGVRRWRRED
jgi:hypothetical protein